jgi:pyruvate formate lyase activating enzyme
MRIAGLVKNSFVDYPGCIAAVVFVPGCNMDCWYCHNKHLWKSEEGIELESVYEFLETHRDFLDGVVISGGEPTLQDGLPEFIDAAKGMGYFIKLDTNGTKPDVVEKLMNRIDYIAMDVKAPPGEIKRVVTFDMDEAPVWKTADMLISGRADYEFRTTFMPLLEVADIEKISERIAGAKRYALQQYRKAEAVKLAPEPHSKEKLKEAAKAARKYAEEVIVRGI